MPYDFFLSHAHEDKQDIERLADVLANYWVPRRRRRRVFVDNRSLQAGSLNHNIKTALRESQYLVICVSVAAARSEWVGREIQYFLGEAGHSVDRVLFCRVGDVPADLGSGDALLTVEWLVDQEARLGRPAGDFLIPDLRPGSGRNFVEEALTLLAVQQGLGDKDHLLDRRHRFVARLWRGGIVLLFVLVLGFITASWWLQTPTGTMWQHERSMISKAQGLKFDYPDTVGPAVVALARGGERRKAEGLAAMVKGKYFHPAMELAIASAGPEARADEVSRLVAAAGSEVASGYEFALLLAYKVNRDAALWEKARAAYRAEERAWEWLRALAEAGLDAEAQSEFLAWRMRDVSKLGAGEFFLRHVWMNVLLGAPLPDDPAGEDAWLASMAEEKSIYEAQKLFLDAAMNHRLADLGVRRLLLRVAEVAMQLRLEGRDPGRMAQPLAAMLAMAGDHDTAKMLLQLTPTLETGPLDNDAAEPLAFRALAVQGLGNRKLADELFVKATLAANAPIEATRTWNESSELAKALVLADRWHQAIQVPPTVGAELARHRIELEIIIWWQKLHR